MTDKKYYPETGAEQAEGNFAEMLEQSFTAGDGHNPGDKVRGRVIQISDETVFVDISGKSEAMVPLAEFNDEKSAVTIKEGDEIDAWVVSTRKGEILLTTRIGKGKTGADIIKMAWEENIPVEGNVESIVKGGYSVNLSGHRCFCPFSQIDIKPDPDEKSYLNKSLSFKIIEFSERGKNIILSRRTLLQEKADEQKNLLKQSLKEGDILDGTVRSVREFGVFVDIGGIEGLVHRSELSWSRSASPDSLSSGERVKVKVQSFDWKTGKISLSIKDTLTDPWESVSKYSEGAEYPGKVANIINNGAFIELEPGIEGFLHISGMSRTKRINKPEEVLTSGDRVSVLINRIDARSKKISLDLVTGDSDPWAQPDMLKPGETVSGIIETSKSTGVNIRLENGMLGFAPKKELALGAKADILTAYPAGRVITAAVKDIQPASKNLILSEILALKEEELKDYNSFVNKSAETGDSSLGSLLKDQFSEVKKSLGVK